MMTEKKPIASEKKSRSSKRNFLKARISSITFEMSLISNDESTLVHTILNARDQLLKNWDNNTAVILGSELPKYKCCVCGRRLNMEYRFENDLYCYKHYRDCRNVNAPDSNIVSTTDNQPEKTPGADGV